MAAAVLHLSLPVRDLAEARRFYEDVLECRIGRVRDAWIDVWFFGLQLTLHDRPGEVLALRDQGVRHFGVSLHDVDAYDALVARLASNGVCWLSEPAVHGDPLLSGKVGGAFAGPERQRHRGQVPRGRVRIARVSEFSEQGSARPR